MKFDKFINEQLPKEGEHIDFIGEEQYEQLWSDVYPDIESFYKKKKRRGIVLWLLFPILLVGIITTGMYFSNQKVDENSLAEPEKLTSKIIESTVESTTNIDLAQDVDDISLINESYNSLDHVISNLNAGKITDAKDFANVVVAKKRVHSTTETITKEKSQQSKSAILPQIFTSSEKELNQESKTKESDFSIIDHGKTPGFGTLESDLFPTIFLSGNSLTLFPKLTGSLLESIQTTIVYEPQFFELDTDKKRYREIGIGHTRFVNNPFTNSNRIRNDRAIFNYSSLNLILSRRYNHRFSFTSGFHYLRQKVWVPFKLYDEPYVSGQNSFQNSIVAENTDGSPSQEVLQNSINDDALAIQFLPGAQVNEGDLLDAAGSATILLDIYQIPFQLDYHMGHGKWELICFTGISLNYFRLQLSEFPIEIYKDGILVSNDINFRPIRRHFVLPNLILGSGVRYQLSEKYALHMLLNLNPLDLRFARLQFGVMKNWQ